MPEITMTSDDIKRLSDELDARCADLDEQSRIHLQAVFSLAGEAAAARAADQEVSGFSMSFGALLPAVQTPGFAGTGRTVPWNQAFEYGGSQASNPGGNVSLNPQPLPPKLG